MHRPSYEVLKVTDGIYFTFCDGMRMNRGVVTIYAHTHMRTSENPKTKTFYFIYLFDISIVKGEVSPFSCSHIYRG